MTQTRGKIDSIGTLNRLKKISRIMDTSIRLPGGYRIGWDGIVGLIPGIGDLVGMVISLYIVTVAMRLGASKTTLLRMLGNIGVETAIGTIPVVGDIFDLAFKANTRNMKILDKHVVDPIGTYRQSNAALIVLLMLAIVLLLLMTWFIVSIVSRIFMWLF